MRIGGVCQGKHAINPQDKLAASGQQQSNQTVALQTILTLVGFWDGPIDGVWTDELTQALKNFQTSLGVEPTGVVDTATIAAFQQALAGLSSETPPATTVAPNPTEPPTPTSIAPMC